MNLEQLKAALDAALAALAADQENVELKAVADAAQADYDTAKAAADANSGDPDESKLDEKTKAYLAKLRKENATHRTKAKDLGSKLTAEQARTKAILKAAGIEDETEKPEEKLKSLTQQSNEMAFRSAILESAIEHGIPKDGLKYYQFLISEATDGLGEGEELSDENLTEIVNEVKKGFGGKKAANSTVTGKDGKTVETPDPNANAGLTFDKFCAMSIIEKSKLYSTNPAQYEGFMAQAKAKKKLI